LYSGSGIGIQDAIVVNGVNIPSISSGTIPISNTGTAVNIELSIDSLIHNNPSDLSLFLQPPSGDSILLSYRNKINNHNQQLGTKFVFSNKAQPDVYLYNKPNNDIYVNILQNEIKTLPAPYNSLTYKHDFNHLINAAPGALSGNWNLFVVDHDIGLSGLINNWHLIITYNPPIYTPEL
jgi:subtilisin-like proprotein convertase family protein